MRKVRLDILFHLFYRRMSQLAVCSQSSVGMFHIYAVLHCCYCTTCSVSFVHLGMWHCGNTTYLVSYTFSRRGLIASNITAERINSSLRMRNTAKQQIRHMIVHHPVFVHYVWSNQCNILCNFIQVKVLLKWRLKLIVVTSLRVHMVTRLDHICVQCVTNGLEVEEAWIVTN